MGLTRPKTRLLLAIAAAGFLLLALPQLLPNTAGNGAGDDGVRAVTVAATADEGSTHRTSAAGTAAPRKPSAAPRVDSEQMKVLRAAARRADTAGRPEQFKRSIIAEGVLAHIDNALRAAGYDVPTHEPHGTDAEGAVEEVLAAAPSSASTGSKVTADSAHGAGHEDTGDASSGFATDDPQSRPTAPAIVAGAAKTVLEPFRCELRHATMHVPRNASDVQRSPASRSGAACCTPVKDDIDRGLTMYHLLTRYLCAVHPSPFRVRVTSGSQIEPAAGGAGGLSDAPRIRVLQIGANTGDNENDHLFRFLRQRHWAEAVLMEPVPWLFAKLQAAYKGLVEDGVVTLVNAAAGREDGSLPFFAPVSDAPGWVKQMGGFSITPRNHKVLVKRKMLGMIRKTTVQVRSLGSVLHDARPSWRGKLPHVVVIDTEGFDAHVVGMLLDAVAAEAAKRPSVAASEAWVIPIIQYEWKHLSDADNAAVIARLQALGYCTLRVHYDLLAYHAATMEQGGIADRCDVEFAVTRP